MRRNLTAAAALGIVVAGMLAGGCKQDQPKRKYHEPVEGTALEINTESGEVSMELVDPGTGMAVVRKGLVNDKTQIQINGVTARIEDVHKGDAVKVTYYSEGPRENPKFVVSSIGVQRADNQWLDTDGAASRPAGAPAGGIESSGPRDKPAGGR